MKRELTCVGCGRKVKVKNYKCNDDVRYTCAKCRGIEKR